MITPVIKWAGGKRQLIDEIIIRMPDDYDTYYEPFLGGGAVAFTIMPEKSVIGDINRSLICTYMCIRDECSALMDRLDCLTHRHNTSLDKKSFYYDIRSGYNERLRRECYDIDTSAMFIYLNRTCFNGLYRVNRAGEFNVPFNGKEKIILYNRSNMLLMSDYLKDRTILCADYHETCSSAGRGDFVFFDSPYVPLNPSTFESYTKEGFSIEQHMELSRLFRELDQKGAYCMLTNHDTDLIRELYKGYRIESVKARRMINRNPDRRNCREVIITNY